MERISSSDISVVVQGPVVGKADDPVEKRLTRNTLESVRRHFPEAEIILSTWRGSDVTNLPYDVLIENEDPGGTVFRVDTKKLNNVNRQIVSTRSGLLKANRAYCMKLRSDMVIEGDQLLDFMGRYPEYSDSGGWRILRERVLACTIYSSNPRRVTPYCFHPSDLFFFGRREDLIDIWDIPLAPEPETSQWLTNRPRPKPDFDINNMTRYAPEQYIWLNFLKKHRPIEFDFQWDVSPEFIAMSELSIVNNLVLLRPDQLQIVFLKSWLTKGNLLRLYTHSDWLHLYKKHCDSSFPVPFHAGDTVTTIKWWLSVKFKFLHTCYRKVVYAFQWLYNFMFHPQWPLRRCLRECIRRVTVLFRPEGKIRRTARRLVKTFRGG